MFTTVRGTLAGTAVVETVQRVARILPGQMVDTVFNRLFAGITMSAAQADSARHLISMLERKQLDETVNITKAAVQSLYDRSAVQRTRDVALRSLLNDDASRLFFDVRVAMQGGGARGGGRGRSGGSSMTDSLGGGMGGGRGARGGGGDLAPMTLGGGRARSGSVVDDAATIDALMKRLFDGITLTPDQDAKAREIIGAAQRDMRAIALPMPTAYLALLPNGKVIMQTVDASVLATVLTNDADRAILESRIVTGNGAGQRQTTFTRVGPPPSR